MNETKDKRMHQPQLQLMPRMFFDTVIQIHSVLSQFSFSLFDFINADHNTNTNSNNNNNNTYTIY